MFSHLLDRLEARVGRHKGIRNLMTMIVIGTAIVFLADYILPSIANGATLSGYLRFDRGRIMHGEIWRLLSFIFVPMEGHVLLLLVSLCFYWLVGSQLQNEWGTFRFTLFYAAGILGSVVSGFITGYATSYYLNMSLILAMSIIRPNMLLRVNGLFEVRIKWLALFSLVMLILPLLQSRGWQQPVALIAALINVLLFFMDGLVKQFKEAYRRYMWKKNWRNGSWKR